MCADKLDIQSKYKIPLEVWDQYELLGELRSAHARIRMLEDGNGYGVVLARLEEVIQMKEALVHIRLLERCREELTRMVQELMKELESTKKTTL